MPGHTSRPPGHPSILEAVINYRGARRSKELFLVLASGQRRGFIEDGLSNPSIPYGGDRSLFSKRGVYPLGRSSRGKCKIEGRLSFEGKS